MLTRKPIKNRLRLMTRQELEMSPHWETDGRNFISVGALFGVRPRMLESWDWKNVVNDPKKLQRLLAGECVFTLTTEQKKEILANGGPIYYKGWAWYASMLTRIQRKKKLC